jgi:hypothetical protein
MDAELNQQEEESIVEAVETEAAAQAECAEAGTVQAEVTAETVYISQGGAQMVRADKVYVEQGGIARAEARFIDVSEGGIGIAQGENISITEGGAGIIAAENVKMQDSVAVFVAANEIEGEGVTVVFDVRAAVVFALVLGTVTSLFKLVTRRRS